MKDFTSKTVVITGAANGIGKALAQAFADRGAKLVLSDRDLDALLLVSQDLLARGYEVVSQKADVSNPDDMERLVETSYQQFGKVHVLCNNAGIIGSTALIAQLSLDNWNKVLDINVKGTIHGLQAFLPRMLASGEDAHILNTASVGSVVRQPRIAPYYASKSAVMAISECTALECEGSNVKVSILCPGAVATQLANSSLDDDQSDEEIVAANRTFRDALAGGVAPEEIASAALQGIENGALYIFTHPEYKDQIRERFERILAACP